MDNNSLAHTKWNCKHHIVFTPKYRRQALYRKRSADIGQMIRVLCQRKEIGILQAAARYEKATNEYAKNPLREDMATDQMSVKEYTDPFMGEPVNKGK